MQSYPLMHFSQLLKHPAKKKKSQHSLTSAVLLRSHLPATDRPNPKYCNWALAFLLRRRMVLTMTPSKNEAMKRFWNRTLCFKGGWIGHFHLKVHAKHRTIGLSIREPFPGVQILHSGAKQTFWTLQQAFNVPRPKKVSICISQSQTCKMQGGKAFYNRASSLKCPKYYYTNTSIKHNKGGRHAFSYATGL